MCSPGNSSTEILKLNPRQTFTVIIDIRELYYLPKDVNFFASIPEMYTALSHSTDLTFLY